MEVWIVVRDWSEEIEEYDTHHNDEFQGVFATQEAANKYIETVPNRNWETNNYRAHPYTVQS